MGMSGNQKGKGQTRTLKRKVFILLPLGENCGQRRRKREGDLVGSSVGIVQLTLEWPAGMLGWW